MGCYPTVFPQRLGIEQFALPLHRLDVPPAREEVLTLNVVLVVVQSLDNFALGGIPNDGSIVNGSAHQHGAIR